MSTPAVPFQTGWPTDWPIRPANYIQLDYFARTRNFIHIWLPEGLHSGVRKVLFILNEPVSFHFERIGEHHWAHTFEKPGTLSLRGEVRPIAEGIEMSLRVMNLSDEDWPDLQPALCVQLIAAPDFADTGLERTFGMAGRARVPAAQPADLGKPIKHFVLAEPVADNFIAVESRCGEFVVAQWWPGAPRVGGNCHGSIACIHAQPTFGPLAKGESTTRTGRLYLMAGSVEAAYSRYLAERGAAASPG